ncbi:UDP-N-acetylglucosamine--dolichyl-phosphate N-acetylglucosaminephosphotransferase [Schistocerca cancellata]|uniref:UDP-N-acetylglucosamine--dolichyl-phosphate N-acetylglucosaminephosphotransferase n=1 Tax=Schistocerca cancellata TaxID=274614 RepID=UPI002118184D|nr:UDP-N-acetylglucosamine--dolichyl-phosphate N-acetylglucosaminephosphotransferase [Schistocerca cancellata]
MYPLALNAVMSVASYFCCLRIIPKIKETFIKANLYGIDMSKRKKEKIPEAIGVVVGCIFLITLFLFIPLPFGQFMFKHYDFPHDELVELVAALLSICCMLLLGFADDVLDLRWRHKLLLPTVASLPLLMVYYVNFNSTTIIVPRPFRIWLGFSVDLGVLYYCYMGMLAVFCTNAINILAGVNGLEAGQSLVIALSIAIFNVIELTGSQWKAHQFSLYFMLPYIATTAALLRFNWYPSRVFVGDTFCYFSGMTFAVVGILGHFSKTMLLFFIPQVVNFVYSVPQLFHILPCPRHRLPRYNADRDIMEASTVKFSHDEVGLIGIAVLKVLPRFKLLYVHIDKNTIEINNMTIINLTLLLGGPAHESVLTSRLLVLQGVCSILAFIIRYPMAALFYDVGPA